MYPPCLRSVSTSSRISGDSGDKEDTKRIQVSTLSPLCHDSEFFREVLRLGLEGTNPRISLTPLVSAKDKLCTDALLSGFRKLSAERRYDNDAGHPELAIRHCLGQCGKDIAEFAGADIFENGVDAPAPALPAVMTAYPATPNKNRIKAYWIFSLAAKISGSG
jgi:hypothetical protein